MAQDLFEACQETDLPAMDSSASFLSMIDEPGSSVVSPAAQSTPMSGVLTTPQSGLPTPNVWPSFTAYDNGKYWIYHFDFSAFKVSHFTVQANQRAGRLKQRSLLGNDAILSQSHCLMEQRQSHMIENRSSIQGHYFSFF